MLTRCRYPRIQKFSYRYLHLASKLEMPSPNPIRSPPWHTLTRFGSLGPAGCLGSSPAMDNLAPAMVVGHGCFDRFDYTRPRSGPG
ncbi:unnamed protein product [Echinostoma caproni]|uniref:Uncharacterized protein n=1 Tax=Echinostoma caproni TaxID=27848 RepID=A0A183ARU1_9TREM|nr:unnamed protein product [Echinostoma caproni]